MYKMIKIRLQYAMPKLVISVLFSVLFFSLTTFAQESESDFDKHLTCCYPIIVWKQVEQLWKKR